MKTTRKSMLTCDTLDLFEKLVDMDQFTDSQIKDIEHCAYCANMGATSQKAAWDWFCHLIHKYYGIDGLENLYEERHPFLYQMTGENITEETV